MNVTTLDPLGAIVTDLDVGPLDGPRTADLRDLLAERGVLIFPGQQDVDDTDFLAFLASFGDLMFTEGETAVEGFPDLNVVSNVGRTRPPRSSFHVDTSYVAEPPAYTALRAVLVPDSGGETLFSDQYAALATLDPQLRDELEGRDLRHVVTGVDLPADRESEALHPLALTHPISGRAALYLTTPARCREITGFDAARSAAVVEQLFDHSTRAENVLAHAWSPGDVVMWDNRCVLHRADHAAVNGDRVMHRGMVAADREPGGSP